MSITISDEKMSDLSLLVTLDGDEISEVPDQDGSMTVDISELGAGSHALKVIAIDSLGQETSWSKAFIVHYPGESDTELEVSESSFEVEQGGDAPISGNVVHDDISTCELRWSTTDIAESSLGLPIGEDGGYELELSNIQENTTVSLEASCGTWTETSSQQTVIITVLESVSESRKGCTDPDANNYDSGAEEDDGSCEYDDSDSA